MKYDLKHLTQDPKQNTPGPIQDDEALLLFALCRVMLIKRVLECGTLEGYSTRNFCKAVGVDGVVYSCDIAPVPTIAPNHIAFSERGVETLTADDLGNVPLDLVFFDCHAYEAMTHAFQKLRRANIINDETVLAVHDTNLIPAPLAPGAAYQVQEGGFVHCPPESQFANDLKDQGYDVFALTTKLFRHALRDAVPYRCGISLARKYKRIPLRYGASAPWMTGEKEWAKAFRQVGSFDYERVE